MEKEKFDWSLFIRIICALKPNPKKLTIVAIGILASTIISFFQPLVIKVITDDGLVNLNMKTILLFALLLLGLVIIDRLIEVALSFLFSNIRSESELRISTQAFHKLLRVKSTYFIDKNESELINSISTDVNIVSSLIDSYNFMLIGFVFKIISGLSGLLVISPTLTVCVLIVVPIKYFVVRKFSKIRELKTSQYIEKYKKFSSWMSDTINGIIEIKLWNIYKIKNEEFIKNKKTLLESNQQFTMIDSWNMFFEFNLEWIVAVILYICGGMLIINNKLSLGGLFAFISYSSSVTSPISAVLNIKMILAKTMPSAKRLFKFLDLEEEINGSIKTFDIADISFENVHFSYDNKREILSNISFSIPKGYKVAIIGENGSGKSTIINMILRFFNPTSGEIRLGKIDIKDIDLNKYRELFAVVTQDSYLFNKTIKKNIDLENNEDESQLSDIYIKSGVAGYLDKMPKGEHSIIGNNAARLSGGEKQKIAVARALIKDAPFVILDEPTSSFDTKSDQYLHDLIINQMKNKTVILITHKCENLKGIDIVYKVENGKIIRIN